MKRIMKKFVAALLVCLSVFSFSACSFEFEEPDWIKEKFCDHVFDEKEVLKEATCGTSGRLLKVCSDCGKTEYDTIKATGEHAFDEGVQEDGVIIYTCNVCGKTKTEEIPACTHVDANNDIICDNCSEDLYLFVSESRYTEVEAVVGETVVGNWYRVYGRQEIMEGQTNVYKAEGFYLTANENILLGFLAGPTAISLPGVYNGGDTSNLLSQDSFNLITAKTGENEKGSYIDFYIRLGSCDYTNVGYEYTLEITETAAISKIFNNKVYRLEVNKK